MVDEKYIRYAVEYAQDDARLQFAPSQDRPLEKDFRQVQKKSPSLVYERWLEQLAKFARLDNQAYRNEKYYAETSAEYDKAYIAAIVKIDSEKFPKEQ